MLILWLSFLLGAAHTLSPDHWVPLSLQSWQKGWGAARTRGLAVQLYLLHVLTGLLCALIIREWASGLDDRGLMVFSLGLVAVGAVIRFIRLPRLREVFLAGPQSRRGVLAAWSLLGPAESVIPLVLKALQMGHGYVLPVACYTLGTLVGGDLLIMWGRRAWNQPGAVTHGWEWLQRVTILARPFARRS